MNTDVILDFFVDYYIWFIIGGSVLLLAIIGFIADKKKLFTKQDNKNSNEKLELNNDINNYNQEDNQAVIQDNEENNSVDLLDDKEIENQIEKHTITENIELMPKNDTLENSALLNEEVSIDNNNNDSLILNNNNQENIENVFSNINNLEQNMYAINDSDYEENNVDENASQNDSMNNVELTNSDENISDSSLLNNEKVQVDVPNVFSENLIEPETSPISNIDEDINKINSMVFDNTTETENAAEIIEKSEVKQNIGDDDYNFAEMMGDNSDKTVQVNYSQLKEMVEDIIAETQKEIQPKQAEIELNQYTEPVANESFINKKDEGIEGIKDIPLPNLNNIAVDAIRQQDEDEDDVWKF